MIGISPNGSTSVVSAERIIDLALLAVMITIASGGGSFLGI